ncbi:hypothetical protein GIB67_023137 [Kingdonia uniflora]|uniref:Pentatricopeptide repeat-containing protein n=1 Tax=Kingdonia uniflora TaxID=39325 RepID=A0A7J7M5R9_9MAGN|nr:hypothetical protein GIB67_023137 [Kingdonia uniflora]
MAAAWFNKVGISSTLYKRTSISLPRCMIDLLGRARELSEAYVLIKGMPFKPDSVLWAALLMSCSFYGNIEFAEEAADALFELEPWNPGVHVILSNIMHQLVNRKEFKDMEVDETWKAME